MTGDRGQALVLAVLALGLAAATIVGLQAAADRILRDAQERRAGEAAVEAAGAAVADALVELTASVRDERGARAVPNREDLAAFITDDLVTARAQAAADALSAANGGAPVRDLELSPATRAIEIALSVGAHRQRAAVGIRCCLP